VFYYPGEQFDVSLLIQAFIMIAIQLVLLKVALDHRPGPSSKGGEMATPFAGAREGELGISRPYNFLQWRSPKPYVFSLSLTNLRTVTDPGANRYWQFLLYLFITLTALELLFSPIPTLYSLYSASIGVIGLSIEATLPLPQILSNFRSRSCRGFRVSVIASWIAGDIMKMFWFFKATSEIPWTFKVCGIFQMCCDLFLGGQYFVYGSGEERPMKEHEMRYNGHASAHAHPHAHGRRTPVGEKDVRLE